MAVMNNPTVTVVIPTYNYGRFVTAAVESVLAQTYRNLDVVVVDDGSTDDTRARLTPYLDRIRYIYQSNQGLSAARNTGIRAAKGELIALLDSDDTWHPRKLEVQVAYLSNHPEIDLLASDHWENVLDTWPALPELCTVEAKPVTARQLAVRSYFGACAVLVRARCFDTVGLFDTELRSVEDRDMWIRMASHFRVFKLETPLWWCRRHTGSMSTVARCMEQNELKVLRKAFAPQSALHGNWFIQMQAHSYMARTAGFMYDDAGMYVPGLTRMIRSLLLWPFPYTVPTFAKLLERLRKVAVISLRLARLKAPALAALPPREPVSEPIAAGTDSRTASAVC